MLDGVPGYRILGELRLSLLNSRREHGQMTEHLVDEEPIAGVDLRHSGTASASIRGPIAGCSPPRFARSTFRPRTSSRSDRSPAYARSETGRFHSTRKSTSLFVVASRRRTEPKTRSSFAPYFRARSRIAARWGRTTSSIPRPVPSRTGRILGTSQYFDLHREQRTTGDRTGVQEYPHRRQLSRGI